MRTAPLVSVYGGAALSPQPPGDQHAERRASRQDRHGDDAGKRVLSEDLGDARLVARVDAHRDHEIDGRDPTHRGARHSAHEGVHDPVPRATSHARTAPRGDAGRSGPWRTGARDGRGLAQAEPGERWNRRSEAAKSRVCRSGSPSRSDGYRHFSSSTRSTDPNLEHFSFESGMGTGSGGGSWGASAGELIASTNPWRDRPVNRAVRRLRGVIAAGDAAITRAPCGD